MAYQPFPWRAIFIGALLSLLVALYSSYAGLKIGGVYWPMVTTAVVSLALVRALGSRDKQEINIMQTTASTGGLLAAGVIFTIPAIYMLVLDVSPLDVVLVSLTGGMLGLLFAYPLRQRMIMEEKLPYADGTAAAAIILAGDEKGKHSRTLFASLGIGAAYAALNNAVLSLPLSLIPFAGGYLIGTRFTTAWFIGALATVMIISPYFGGSSIVEIAKPLGVGIVIGAAVAYFITAGMPVFLRTAEYYKKAKMGNWGMAAILLTAVLLIYAFNLPLPVALLAVAGAFFMAFIGAKITGEMNVDPMEIFALIVLLAAKFIFGFGALHLVLLAAVVCIAAGIAGDAMQDFKTGHILGTPPEHQLAAEAVGVVSASLIMGALMLSFSHVGFGGTDFPAPQATAVEEIIQQGGMPGTLITGMVLGFAFTLITWKLGYGAVAIAFGIGLYVPFMLSLPLFIGGIARLFIERAGQVEKWRLVAGGVIAGEGLVGVILVLAAAARFLGI